MYIYYFCEIETNKCDIFQYFSWLFLIVYIFLTSYTILAKLLHKYSFEFYITYYINYVLQALMWKSFRKCIYLYLHRRVPCIISICKNPFRQPGIALVSHTGDTLPDSRMPMQIGQDIFLLVMLASWLFLSNYYLLVSIHMRLDENWARLVWVLFCSLYSCAHSKCPFHWLGSVSTGSVSPGPSWFSPDTLDR